MFSKQSHACSVHDFWMYVILMSPEGVMVYPCRLLEISNLKVPCNCRFTLSHAGRNELMNVVRKDILLNVCKCLGRSIHSNFLSHTCTIQFRIVTPLSHARIHCVLSRLDTIALALTRATPSVRFHPASLRTDHINTAEVWSLTAPRKFSHSYQFAGISFMHFVSPSDILLI